jgi:hypothetical protein
MEQPTQKSFIFPIKPQIGLFRGNLEDSLIFLNEGLSEMHAMFYVENQKTRNWKWISAYLLKVTNYIYDARNANLCLKQLELSPKDVEQQQDYETARKKLRDNLRQLDAEINYGVHRGDDRGVMLLYVDFSAPNTHTPCKKGYWAGPDHEHFCNRVTNTLVLHKQITKWEREIFILRIIQQKALKEENELLWQVIQILFGDL